MLTFQDFFQYMEDSIKSTEQVDIMITPVLGFQVYHKNNGLCVDFVKKEGDQFCAKVSFQEENMSKIHIYGCPEDSTAEDPYPEFWIKRDQLFGYGTTKATWWVFAGLEEYEYDLIKDFFGPVDKAKNPPVPEVHRPNYMTFGDFWNFCMALRPDWYAACQPVQELPTAILVPTSTERVNFCVPDPDTHLAMTKISFISTNNGSIRVYKTKNGLIDTNTLVEYPMDDPFCFGDNVNPVTWWKKCDLTLDEIEWIKKTVKPFFMGDKIH